MYTNIEINGSPQFPTAIRTESLADNYRSERGQSVGSNTGGMHLTEMNTELF